MIGASACVAGADQDSTSRVEDQDQLHTDFGVINEVAQPEITPDHVDTDVVIATGVHIPGAQDSRNHINLSSVDTATLDSRATQLCALAGKLPIQDVCSSICAPDGAAKLWEANGGNNDCTSRVCNMGAGITATITVCE
ncbi:MAG TPA: hypothetical protein VGM90_27500 [Kofleriaceae bacterium]